MSLAIDFLRQYFLRPDAPSQADFGKASGMTGANVTDILKGDVVISGRNMPKLLRGLGNERDRSEFLVAYLLDQVPSDYADQVVISRRHVGAVHESDANAENLELDLVRAFNALPSEMHRKRTVRFLQHLRRDAALRDLFSRTVAYLEEADLGSSLTAQSVNSVLGEDTDPDHLIGAPDREGAVPPRGAAAAPGKRTASRAKRA